MATFPERLKELRKAKSLTQKELGQAIGVQQGAINKWESGQTEPSLEKIEKLASTFRVTVDYLLGITSEKTITLLSFDEAKLLDPEGYKKIEDWFNRPYPGYGLDLSKHKMEDIGLGLHARLSDEELIELKNIRKKSNTENTLGTNTTELNKTNLNDL